MDSTGKWSEARVDRLAYYLRRVAVLWLSRSNLLRHLMPLVMRHVAGMVAQLSMHWSPNQKVCGSSTDQGHPVVFWGKLVYSDLHPGVNGY